MSEEFDTKYFVNFSENKNNTENHKGFTIILNLKPQSKPIDHLFVQVVIIVTIITLIILIGLLICNICCKCIREREHMFERSTSENSIQELIRARLQDRPPSYLESQNNLNLNTTPECNQDLSNVPPPVYTISSKISDTFNIHLPYMECESDTDSPPSYHNSEGVTPVFTNCETDIEHNTERDFVREFYFPESRTEFYI